LLDFLAVTIFSTHIEKTINAHYCSETADVITILFSDFDEKGGLGEETLQRLQDGLNIYKKQKDTIILCVGGRRKKSGRYGSILMADWLVNHNVPSKHIYYEKMSYDTVTNLKSLRDFMSKNKYASVTLVSSPYHLFRVFYLLEKERLSFRYCCESFEDNRQDTSKPLLFNNWLIIQRELAVFVLYMVLPRSIYNYVIDTIRQY